MNNRDITFLKFLGYTYVPENSSGTNMTYVRASKWENKNMSNVNKTMVNLPSEATIDNWEWAMLIFNKLKKHYLENNLPNNDLNELTSILLSDSHYNDVQNVVEEEFIVKHNDIVIHSSKKTIALAEEECLKTVSDKRLQAFLSHLYILITRLDLIKKWDESGFLHGLHN
jgi:hypothetical protein